MSPFVFAFDEQPRIFGVAPTKTQNSVIAWSAAKCPGPHLLEPLVSQDDAARVTAGLKTPNLAIDPMRMVWAPVAALCACGAVRRREGARTSKE